MAAETPICDFGWRAPDFDLPDAAGRVYRLSELRGEKGTLVIFICNHCPYVKAVIDRVVDTSRDLRALGINTVAINANDWQNYPEDAPEKMLTFAELHGFDFPYLVDETQDVALQFDAVCTPDFFGFNGKLELQYRGRLDESRKEAVPGAKRELFDAMKQVAETGKGPAVQYPSMGCSIKWRQ